MLPVSPYLKSLSMTTANKLVHLVEAFSTPWFLFSSQNNHHLVFFLLEVFNNIIQYQFDGRSGPVGRASPPGNASLVYTIIRKRQVFYQLANLSSDLSSIQQSLKGKRGRTEPPAAEPRAESPAKSEPDRNALQSTLAATPQISAMTDKGTAWAEEADSEEWRPTPEWVEAWKGKLPLQTIMRLLQVLVPQVEKICIDK